MFVFDCSLKCTILCFVTLCAAPADGDGVVHCGVWSLTRRLFECQEATSSFKVSTAQFSIVRYLYMDGRDGAA